MKTDAYASMNDIRKIMAERKAGIFKPTLNEKFQMKNFDLIVWEYITKN